MVALFFLLVFYVAYVGLVYHKWLIRVVQSIQYVIVVTVIIIQR